MDDLVMHPSRWGTMEESIQYLRELAVLEVICRDSSKEQSPAEPDEVQCTQSMWQKLVWSSSSLYTNSLALMSVKEGKQTVLQVTTWLQQYGAHLFSSLLTCTLSVERLFKTAET